MPADSPIVSAIVVLHGVSAADERFVALRRTAAQQGGATEQYYGEEKPWSQWRPVVEGVPQPLIWVIQWPKVLPTGFDKAGFREAVNALDANGAAESYSTPFDNAALPRPSLTAPTTEFGFLVIDPARLSDPVIVKAAEKTFTDCYDAPDGGFSGGHWGQGTSHDPTHDRLFTYYMGFESLEACTKYSKTELYALELITLKPATKNAWAIWTVLERASDI
ncbi:hypothetical protein EXIGLDRAFT_703986 [Exidia glandulosa HHB12029]|uniref:ABM domain-containing protein n=1 Tax=Exidia glandulosa HHB12029 TaxID=1314781 RepID=A0A165BVR9_EXIGL|nr:hypothetical protein EXIGLDRAFT_703986 [Exidia glandulosa HHB12029]